MGRVLTRCLVGTILRALRLFRVAVFAGAAVLGGLLSVLGGLAAVGLGLEPVQGCLVALARCGVTTSRSSVAQVDEVSAVTGPGVAIAGAPVPIDRSLPAVERGVLHRGHPRRLVTQLGSPVTQPGSSVTVICRHIPGHRPIQELVDLGVPLPTATISCISCCVALVGEAVAAVGGGIPLIGRPVPLVRQPIARVRGLFPLVQPTLRSVMGARTLSQVAPCSAGFRRLLLAGRVSSGDRHWSR